MPGPAKRRAKHTARTASADDPDRQPWSSAAQRRPRCRFRMRLAHHDTLGRANGRYRVTVQIDPTRDDAVSQWTLRLGSQHPAGHGPITMNLKLDGVGEDAVVTWAEPQLVPLHRGVEKLFESRDYRQALMLADRHEWHSAFGSELGLALTIESMSGISVPPRAVWIRTAMAELNRAIHHLRWVGETIGECGDDPAAFQLRDAARSHRDALLHTYEAMSGGRLHPMLVVPGGVREDTPPQWTDALRSSASGGLEIVDGLSAWVDSRDDFVGVGVLDPTDAIECGASGPVARASGVALDLRFDDPSLAYRDLAESGILQRVTRGAGDARARLEVLVDELRVSLYCVTAAAEQLDSAENQGQVNVRLPRAVRVPEGSGYGWTENPSGINGWHLTSRGGPMPYRLKIRSASFANAQAICQAVVGEPVTSLPITLMTSLWVSGDLGK